MNRLDDHRKIGLDLDDMLLIDDMTMLVKPGCDKYGIALIHPKKLHSYKRT